MVSVLTLFKRLDVGYIASVGGRSPAPAISFMSLAVQGGSRFVYSWFIGRVWGAEALAYSASGIAFVALVSLMWANGANAAAVKYVGREVKRSNVSLATFAIRYLAARSIFVGGVGLIAATGYFFISGEAAISAILLGPALLSVSAPLTQVLRGIHYASGAVLRTALIEAACVFLSLLVAGVLINSGADPAFSLLPLSIAYLVYCFSSAPSTKGWDKNSAGVEEAGDIRNFILLASLGSVASAGLVQISMLLVRRLEDANTAATYAAAFMLIQPLTLIASSVGLSIAPSLSASEVTESSREGLALVRKSVLFLSVLVVPIVTLGIVLSPAIVSVLWGESYNGAASPLSVFLMASGITTMNMPYTQWLVAKANRIVRTTTVVSWVGGVAGCLSWVVLYPRLDITGIALGVAVSMVCISLINVSRAFLMFDRVTLNEAAGLMGALTIGAFWAQNFFGGGVAGWFFVSFFAVCWIGCVSFCLARSRLK